jgi:hypothetical protein
MTKIVKAKQLKFFGNYFGSTTNFVIVSIPAMSMVNLEENI